jgi:polynucleotide 5'-kinase involved in rRNA processing
MNEAASLHIPDEWAAAMARLAGARRRRIAVLGPADAGKSSFVRAMAKAWLDGGERLAVLDLDPGQKMIGPPGSVALGHLDGGDGRPACTRFRFVGSTSSIVMRPIVAAAAALRPDDPFVVNSSGFVAGPGAWLQAATVAAAAADAVVAIGLESPPLPAGWTGELLRLSPSPAARRKSPASRARARQEAFALWLGDAAVAFGAADLAFDPGPPRRFEDARRPVCCLADAGGDDMAIGVVEDAAGEALRIRTTDFLPRSPHTLRLGGMWAMPTADGWTLVDRLEPAWAAPD